METRQVDVMIFGATGFTGKLVVLECAKRNSFSWAVAGRNMSKIRELLQKITTETGVNVNDVPVVETECANEASMENMAKMAKVVINCSGPFRYFGESVVKACVEHGTNYVDISGEPEFMEKMQLLYFDSARAKGCYIVSSCGMDSVPVDLGIVHFAKNFDGQVNYVESYMRQSSNSDNYQPITNFTTWESAVHGFANVQSLIEVRKKLFSKVKRVKPTPSMPDRGPIHRSEIFENKYSVPFPGSDKSVVFRTQTFLFNECGLRPVQCNAFLVCDTIIILFAVLVVGYFLQLLTKYEWGKQLLLKYPDVFSMGMMTKTGPSPAAQASATATFRFYGTGWSKEAVSMHANSTSITEPTDSEMITELHLQNPAYGFTSMCVVECACILIQEPENLPSKGGVYTPGFAFYRTNIFKRLAKRGAEFKVLKKK